MGFTLKNLCAPALLYFVLSFIPLVLIAIYNLNNMKKLCLGSFECYVGNNLRIFIFNFLYILFWTYLLDLLCKNGWVFSSWVLLLFPLSLTFIFYTFIFILFTMYSKKKNKNNNNNNKQ